MRYVRPRKRFGQHYLKDDGVLAEIVRVFRENHRAPYVLEIGPGMGALTRYLWEGYGGALTLVELDKRCIAWLEQQFEGISGQLVEADFLKLDLYRALKGSTSIIGNFPYNISSQIVFRIIEFRDMIPLVVGMFQKEVAERLASGPGSRIYGAISVLVQLHYDVEIAFDIPPEKFDPPPKVVSSLLVMRRHGREYGVDEKAFRSVVKSAFSTRRKKLSNALSGIAGGRELPGKFAGQRAEQLSLGDFVELTKWYAGNE